MRRELWWMGVLGLMTARSVLAQNAAGNAGGFVCVEERSVQPFVVKGFLAHDNCVNDLVIRQVETKAGRIDKTIWEQSAHDVSIDPEAAAVSEIWKNSMAFRVKDKGDVADAVLFLPQAMHDNDPQTVTRSRLKIKMKTGKAYDLRLHCART